MEMALHAMLDTRTLRSRFYQVLRRSSIYLSSIIYSYIRSAGLSLSNSMRAGSADPLPVLAITIFSTIHPSSSDLLVSTRYPCQPSLSLLRLPVTPLTLSLSSSPLLSPLLLSRPSPSLPSDLSLSLFSRAHLSRFLPLPPSWLPLPLPTVSNRSPPPHPIRPTLLLPSCLPPLES